MLYECFKKIIIRLWYPLRYSVTYYNLSHFPKIYKAFSLSGFKMNSEKTKVKPFFIMACGRSGNTLLRAILCNNKDISIPPESFVLGEVYDKFRIFNHLRWHDLLKLIIGEFEAHTDFKDWNINLQPLYAELSVIKKEERTLEKIIDSIFSLYTKKYFPEAIIWGDKTPENNLWMFKIKKIFPEAKYIFLYRDGRDVTASFLKSGLLTNLERISRYWNLNMRLSEIFLRRLKSNQFIELRYEELVTRPEIEVKKICSFLGVTYSEDMLHSYKNFEKLGDVAVHHHHKNIAKPINTKSIGKWKKILSEEEQKSAERIMAKYLRNYDYVKN